jgi:DNA-binding response OmpR family regulator
MHILLVEDDPGIGRFVSRGLTAEGFAVEWLQSAAGALEALRARPFAAAILDLGLPDGDGLELCREMRTQGIDTPVLMLTARETLNDKLDGFRAGADDYLSKPFAFGELLARLNVVARRGQMLRAQTVSVGPLRLDLKARQAICGAEPLALSNREFEVLACMARQPGKAVARQEFLDQVWGADTELNQNTVDVYIGYLRRHLADCPGAPRIETVRGIGFRLTASNLPAS